MESCKECIANLEWGIKRHLIPHAERMDQTKRHFKMRKNQILFTVGQPLNGWYCIKKGSIRVYKVSRNGKEQTYRIVGPGDWLGYRELLEGCDSHFNAVSIKESEICFLPQTIWGHMMDHRPLLMDLIGNLSRDLKSAEDLIFALGTKKLHSRLAELLIALANQETDRTISLTRELMSTMLGSTTESIVRALTDFKDRKWVEVNKNRITLINLEALREVAQMDNL